MSSIIFNTENGIASITLNRPEKLNAFNREMALSLQQHLDFCNADHNTRVIMITGSGRAFSAGQDLAEIAGQDNPGIGRILSEHFNPVISKIYNSQKPVIAAVNGVAAGAGANIALCCDIVVATRSAAFIQAFSKIGLIPDSGGTWFLPRLIGWQRASALMLLGEKVSAEEAEKMGMIYKSIADDQFESSLNQLITHLASLPPAGLALTKRALQTSAQNNLQEQLIEEDELQQQAAGLPEFRNAVTAFITKT